MSGALHSTRLFPKFKGACAYLLSGIAARCDWVLLSDSRPPHIALVKRVETAAPRHIFLSLREPFLSLRFFHTEVLPRLEGRFVLVSGSEDVTLPRQTDRRWRSFDGTERAAISAILDDPRLVCWFAENLDEAQHPRLAPLPVGMVWPNGASDPPLPLPVPPPLGPRPLRVLCAHRIRTGAQWAPRRKVSALATGPWADFTTSPAGEVPEDEFLDLVEAHSFVLCVEGGGLDPSPKAWTALLHGAVPIIRNTPVAMAYSCLPVAIVPEWTEAAITPRQIANWKNSLQPWYDEPHLRKAVCQRLGLEYWWQRILASGA